jgi:ferredoxin
MADFDFIVIGSGPTASVTLETLLESGATVAVVDPAFGPSLKLTEHLDFLSTLPWDNWPTGARHNLLATSSQGTSAKSYFGEDFPYDSELLGIHYSPQSPRASVSLGGFSLVWGATALPFPLGAWPDSMHDVYSDIIASLAKLTQKIGIAGEPGPVDVLYPNSSFTHSLPSTSAFTSMVRSESFIDMVRGSSFSALSLPRLAVAGRANRSEPSEGCTSCGLCQIGCPYNHIWSSRNEIKNLQPKKIVNIQGTVIRVERFNTQIPRVVVRKSDSNDLIEISAKRVLLAAGPISTASILLRSQIVESYIDILDSQTFFVGGVSQKNLSQCELSTTLSEAISLASNEDATSVSHMQVYGPSEYLRKRIFSSSRALLATPNVLQDFLSKYLYVGLGYLDSTQSSSLTVTADQDDSIRIGSSVFLGKHHIKHALIAHSLILRRLGIRLLHPSLQVLSVGGGNHMGASVPMVNEKSGQRNTRIWSDTHGRPFGRGNLHIVDSSILPSVPAGPITLTAMANAHRIAQALST